MAVAAVLVTLPARAEAGFCDPPFPQCLWSLLAPEAPPSPLPATRCPQVGDPPPPSGGDNRCSPNPSACVVPPGDLPPIACITVPVFNSMAAAVAATSALETVWVFGGLFYPCELCPPEEFVYDESVVLEDKPTCLVAKGTDFWNEGAPRDWRYPVTVRSGTADSAVIRILTPATGSCVHGFKLVHRGVGESAIAVGSTASAAEHADNVTVLDNFIDLRQAASTPPPDGVRIAGKGNKVHRNVLVGKTTGTGENVPQSRGIRVLWNNTDTSTCADWEGNEILGNHLSRFDHGVDWFVNAPYDCGSPPWTGNRIDGNDIEGCGVGIIASAASPIPGVDGLSRLIIMGNKITNGEPWTTGICQGDTASQGIFLNDSHGGEVVGNNVSGVQIGIHLGYSACYTRVKRNQVSVVRAPTATVLESAILVCPSDCNWLVENLVSGDGTLASAGIDFTDRSQAPCPGAAKPHGTHIIDGGVVHDTYCVTRKRTTASVVLGVPPARWEFSDIDCVN